MQNVEVSSVNVAVREWYGFQRARGGTCLSLRTASAQFHLRDDQQLLADYERSTDIRGILQHQLLDGTWKFNSTKKPGIFSAWKKRGLKLATLSTCPLIQAIHQERAEPKFSNSSGKTATFVESRTCGTTSWPPSQRHTQFHTKRPVERGCQWDRL